MPGGGPPARGSEGEGQRLFPSLVFSDNLELTIIKIPKAHSGGELRSPTLPTSPRLSVNLVPRPLYFDYEKRKHRAVKEGTAVPLKPLRN